MSVEKSKKVHQRFIDEVWMGRNFNVYDEVFNESVHANWGRGMSVTKDVLREVWGQQDESHGKIVRTDIHEKIGEGDLLAVWKTQVFSDGYSEEGLTLWQFKNGKISAFKWFPLPAKSD